MFDRMKKNLNQKKDDYMEFEESYWEEVNNIGEYDIQLASQKDLTDGLEDMLSKEATNFSHIYGGLEFCLANLVGEENSDRWREGLLAELREFCQDDNSAELAAGMALKKGLFRRGGFEMTKSMDGVNVYRQIESVAYPTK